MSIIGTVARFWHEKRYGFITPDGHVRSKDVFVHHSDIQRPLETLVRGMRVEFDVVQSERGTHAANVVEYVDPYADGSPS
jgi:cold shock CspA family protein